MNLQSRFQVASLLVLGLGLGLASCRSTSGSESGHIPLLTSYPVDRAAVRPDSLTVIKLEALAGVAREFADSTQRLPHSIAELLAFRRESEYTNPRPDWAVDAWNRPVVFVLHANRGALLLLSRGADGEVGGADDIFLLVRHLRQ